MARKFIQISEYQIFTTGLADDGTLWISRGNNVWEYMGECPTLENPIYQKSYCKNSEVSNV